MTHSLFRRVALLVTLIGGFAITLTAQDSGALLNVLVRKGILSDEEAEDVRAELSAESQAALVNSMTAGKATRSISLSARVQVQYAYIDSDAAGLPATQHFLLRRLYFGPKAKIGDDWTANVVYDFAGGGWDKALIEWAGYWGSQPVVLDFGVRKVNFGLDEFTSSGKIKAIERSGATRYFVESNNGRRLGAGSYHVGVFLEGNPNAFKGKETGWFYGAAITNPERPDGFDEASSAGNATNNNVAWWGNVGYTKLLDSGRVTAGIGGGLLPDQGGKTRGAGNDMQVFNAYIEYVSDKLSLTAELLTSNNEQGAGAGQDAKPFGIWFQPAYMITDRLEGVFRYSYTDSDGRGIKVSDGVRSAPASLTGDNLTEYYLGFNYYFFSDDMKVQFGYVNGKAERGPSEETAQGVRSQIQVQF